ncbi:MAG: DNA primase-like protein [Candidatus Magnetoglobus multicellularis str. Araruama]|uniref:DNA primase-like protein n=1 Tax=Candidatus Magnetoglobus multicellularis str. Araruama TaxID=890399 RepID=A0A1V1PF84_9BACT|nr:MAG: DNA primase-like protein [Candidatus Magnetoglobus multicellularis str. Araruama]
MDILATLDSMGVKRQGRKIGCFNKSDSTFSLHIYDDGAKCFSCGASYSHRQLLMKLKGEEIVSVKKNFIPEKAVRKFRNALPKKERINIYSDFYNLLQDSKNIHTYLSEKRCIDYGIISQKKIKYLENPVNVANKLRKKYDKESLIKSGLFGVSKREFFYFSFFKENSIVFPFFDKKNRPVYFQTRSISDKVFLKPTSLVEHHYYYGNIFNMKLFVFESIIDCLSYETITGEDNYVSLNTLNYPNIVQLHKRFPNKEIIVVPDYDVAGNSLYELIKSKNRIRNIKAMSLPCLLKNIDSKYYGLVLSKLKLEFDLNDYLKERRKYEKR